VLLAGAPLPFLVEFGEVMEGSCYVSEVPDELVVEVAKADEFPDGFDILGWLPIVYGFYLHMFHLKSIGRQFHT